MAQAGKRSGRRMMQADGTGAESAATKQAAFSNLCERIRACRICVDHPRGSPLPHKPRPVFVPSQTARICICGQAPGTRVHASGRPFTDPSGDRLRAWMGVDEAAFYDADAIAILPMGFCFPGLDAKGGDLPPRRECAEAWRADLFGHMSQVDLFILVGWHAMRWHLRERAGRNVTETVASWRSYTEPDLQPLAFPLPHPSWRNNAWLKANPWFDMDVLPVLRREVGRRLDRGVNRTHQE